MARLAQKASLVLCLVFGITRISARLSSVSVYFNATTGAYSTKFGAVADQGAAAASARFDSAYNETGWAKLDVRGNTAHISGYFAAGLAEGVLTCEFVAAVAANNDDVDQVNNPGVKNYTLTTEAWTRAQAAANPDSDYWRTIAQVLAQFDGLVEGYNRSRCSSTRPLSRLKLWLMQMDGDLEDLKVKFTGEGDREAASLAAWQQPPRPTHCSGLVKLGENHSDLFFGHATWDIYSNMAPRIFKTYSLPVQRDGVMYNHTVHFSSTGPWISSVDDFYTISGTAEMVVMETSNTVLNVSLYDRVQPQSLLNWLRSTVANRLAADGADWAQLFGRFHSGTYTNQWMVVDLSRFEPGQAELQAGLFTVLEEIPGLVHSEDMTPHLAANNYWPSYNVPYFDSIRALNGDSPGSWEGAPRAKLFAMLQGGVDSMASMQRVMRWNKYTTTPSISGGDPCNAIACRADVRSNGHHPISAFGAIDAKASSHRSLFHAGVSNLTVFASAGPTHDDQDTFCWSKSGFDQLNDPHHLHPDCFNFEWERLAPATL